MTATKKDSKSTNIGKLLLQYSGFVAFIALAVFFAVKVPAFLTPSNLSNALLQSSALGIVGLGMTVIFIGGGNDVIKGGIDLSLANNLAVCTTFLAVLMEMGFSLPVSYGITAIIGIFIGAINAFVIVKLKIIPLLGTVAMMYLLSGVELLVSNNKVVGASHPFLVNLADGRFLGLPIIAWAFIVISAVMFLVFNKSVYGNWVKAVGGNTQASMNAGISVNRIVASTYIIASVMAVIASILVVARLSGSVRGIGDMMLFDILLVGYMSAIFSPLFVPNIPGAIFSALFVGMLTNGFTLINVPTYWVYAIKGTLILLAVSITSVQQRTVK